MPRYTILPRVLSNVLRATVAGLRGKPDDEAEEIRANLARIEAVPFDVLPDASRERNVLIALAWLNHDVDAYKPHMSDDWVIWCRPERADMDGRHSVEEWRAICMLEWLRLTNRKDGDNA